MLKHFGRLMVLAYFKWFYEVPRDTTTILPEVSTRSKKNNVVVAAEVRSSNQAWACAQVVVGPQPFTSKATF